MSNTSDTRIEAGAVRLSEAVDALETGLRALTAARGDKSDTHELGQALDAAIAELESVLA